MEAVLTAVPLERAVQGWGQIGLSTADLWEPLVSSLAAVAVDNVKELSLVVDSGREVGMHGDWQLLGASGVRERQRGVGTFAVLLWTGGSARQRLVSIDCVIA